MTIYLLSVIDLDTREEIPAYVFSSMEKLREYVKDWGEDIDYDLEEWRDYTITDFTLDNNPYRRYNG